MTLNNSQRAIMARRRETVARLRLRGMTQREIVVALTRVTDDQGRPDPINVSIATVNTDLKAIESEWREKAAESIGIRKARQLSEIDEAKRRAWTDGDLANLARFIKLETDIFGTSAPVKVTEVPWEEQARLWGVDPELLMSSFEKTLLTGKVTKVDADAGDDDTD